MNKDILLNYVTGKIVEGQPSGDHNWQYNTEYTDTNILNDNFPNGFFVFSTVQCKDSKGNSLPFNIVYGNYVVEEGSDERKGFILLTDNALKEIQLLTQYSSGTDFSPFEALNIDEKGQLYGIDNNNGTKRFIMLNNIIAKLPTQENYSCTLRQSYNLPDKIKNDYFFGVNKSLATNNYLILSQYNTRLTFTNLEIVVGATNNWTYYDYNTENPYGVSLTGIYATWGENTFLFKVSLDTNIIIDTSGSSLNHSEIVVSSENTTPTRYDYTQSIENQNYYVDEVGYAYMISENITYLIFSYENNENKQICMVTKLNYENGKINKLYSFVSNESVTSSGDTFIPYFKDNLMIGLLYHYTSSLVSIDVVLFEEDRYEIIGGTPDALSRGTTFIFNLTKQFDMVTTALRGDVVLYWLPDTPDGTYYSISRGVYGTDVYARNPYESVDGLVPNYIALEDNNELVYARRLYNNSFAGNIMTSSIDIPNSMLNDNNAIQLEGLYSVTNVKINEDNLTTFTKNMYEEVFVNVTTELQFKNDGERYRLNEPTILHNVFSGSNYQNQKISKCDIIYVDDTSKELTLNYTKIKNYYQVSIVMFINKPVKEIRFKSEDGTIIYATNDLTGLQTNKIYKIKKDIWCNDKQAVDKVYYDNEPVYYDDEEVYY